MIYLLRILPFFILCMCCNPETKVAKTASPANESGELLADSITTFANEIFELPSDSIISFSYSTINACKSYKFNYLGANEKYLAETDGYDADNNKIDHLRYSAKGDIEQHIVYVYADKKIAEEYRVERGSSETLYKTKYSYTKDGKLASNITYNFQKQMKAGVDKGWGRPGGCILDQADYEEIKSWSGRVVEVYNYDSTGKIIERKVTYEHGRVESEFYLYDSLGRLKEENTVTDDQFTRTILTSYFIDSTKELCSFHNLDGAGHYTTLRYDKRKNLIDEEGIDSKTGLPYFRRLYTYDNLNRRMQEEYVTNTGTSVFTLYEYENDKPTEKKFVVDNK